MKDMIKNWFDHYKMYVRIITILILFTVVAGSFLYIKSHTNTVITMSKNIPKIQTKKSSEDILIVSPHIPKGNVMITDYTIQVK